MPKVFGLLSDMYSILLLVIYYTTISPRRQGSSQKFMRNLRSLELLHGFTWIWLATEGTENTEKCLFKLDTDSHQRTRCEWDFLNTLVFRLKNGVVRSKIRSHHNMSIHPWIGTIKHGQIEDVRIENVECRRKKIAYSVWRTAFKIQRLIYPPPAERYPHVRISHPWSWHETLEFYVEVTLMDVRCFLGFHSRTELCKCARCHVEVHEFKRKWDKDKREECSACNGKGGEQEMGASWTCASCGGTGYTMGASYLECMICGETKRS